jgi:chromosome segregation ATPase
MRESCLSFFRQGWLGLPIFFVGLVSLAFSQFEGEGGEKYETTDDVVSAIEASLDSNQKLLESLRSSRANLVTSDREQILLDLNNLSKTKGVDPQSVQKLQNQFNETDTRLNKSTVMIEQRLSAAQNRVTDSLVLFNDLKESYGGRLDEAKTPLLTLMENLAGAEAELNALSVMINGVSKDFAYEYSLLAKSTRDVSASLIPEPPVSEPLPAETVSVSRSVSSALNSINPSRASAGDRFVPTIRPSDSRLSPATSKSLSAGDDKEVISRLMNELESSKSFQTELSADSAELQSDLRKAYREIVSLQNNLSESKLLIEELENSKKSFYEITDGNPATAKALTERIKSLEIELDNARQDLRQSRQSLLLEQQRSNSMISTITTELERTRRELDNARMAVNRNGGDAARLAYLESELAKATRALELSRASTVELNQEEKVNLQNELRKSLGEIARMQIELSQMEDLKDELAQLKSSQEIMEGTPSRGASSEFVNKLLVELNAANAELEVLKQGNASEREGLTEGVSSLEQELYATKQQLQKVRDEFSQSKEDIAKREFEFAETIKRLEEEAQEAQVVLQSAAVGSMPTVPYVTDMEESLASSEARIRLLSEQFANEQARASEVIEKLQEELVMAQARHKETLTQLSRSEFELKEKTGEVGQIESQKKKLEEELEVVKVIAGQLQDLNNVLEETKETQVTQSSTSDQVLASLRDELNRMKVELVVTADERDKLQDDYAEKVASLERQLEDTRNEMVEEQEIFYASTNESKNLITELKSELDAARGEIAEMKRSGMSDSVETKQAVSQLQEALGTIRILKESLDEAEQASLQVDNLKAELADSMALQLQKMKESDEEKANLKEEMENLETEIAVLRNTKAGEGVAGMQKATQLAENLQVAQAEIQSLERRLLDAERVSIGSLSELEDEMAFLKSENSELKSELATIGPGDAETIARLESKLSKAVQRLNSMEGGDALSTEIAMLEEDNDRLSEEIAFLRSQMEEPDSLNAGVSEDRAKVAQLEKQLQNAMVQISRMEQDGDPLSDAEMELIMAKETIDSLTESLNSKDLAQSELQEKLEIAFQRINALQAGQPAVPDSTDQMEEIAGLQMEIDTLRAELEQARGETFSNSPEGAEITQIQDELRNAVAQSFELQMELEQTHARMKEMEDMLSKEPEGSLDEFMAKANQAEQEAQQRIDELTNALRNSEQLRAETEDLLTEMERNAKAGGQDISKDPRFLALQQEMVGLQNDLIAAQQMQDPRVVQLEGALEASREDALKLNEEFKGVMADFTNLRDELTALEAENQRIRQISLKQVQETSNPSGMVMQTEINNLSRENANLMAQLAEKERRINGLRDDLAGNARNPTENQLRSQLVQLQIQNQSLSKGEGQAKRDNQQLRQDLDVARENLRNAEARMREMERNAQTPLNRASPAQLAELDKLKVENRSLQSQLQAMGDVPNRDRLETQIRDLNKQNMTYQMQLDREKIMVGDLKKQLADARSIRQEVLERGKSANMKVELLNQELGDARSRVTSLEKALVAAREAIRVLQGGGSERTLIPVSNPTSSFGTNIGRTGGSLSDFNRNSYLPSRRIQLPDSLGDRSSMLQRETFEPSPFSSSRSPSARVQNSAQGNSNLQLQAKVQFLDNKNRPAGFTEFFLVEDDLDTILASEGIQVPTGAGIESPAEYWARSVQRGYRFPGVAAKIRNALARASLKRIKTNSLGEGNLDNLAAGRYYVVGASTLGQVGVVWSKPVTLNSGDNRIDLDLRDAAWAQ